MDRLELDQPLASYAQGQEIPPETHSAILNAFLASYTEEDQGRLRRGSNAGRGGEGGEGPVHKKLMEAIAADPCAVLGESELELVKMECVFCATGDRIDVLLKDRYSQYGEKIVYVLFATDVEGDNVRIVTAYHPDPGRWEPGLKTRRRDE